MNKDNLVILAEYNNGKALLFNEGGAEPFIVASGFNKDTMDWNWGKYFSSAEAAGAHANAELLSDFFDMRRKMEIKENKASKYELIPGDVSGFYRIRALKDFECQGRPVKKGDLGGLVESKLNLSQEGTCWIFDESRAIKSARVCDDAKVENRSFVTEHARVCEHAHLSGAAYAVNNSRVHGEAHIMDEALAGGKSDVGGFAIMKNEAATGGDVEVSEHAILSGACFITGTAKIRGNVEVVEEPTVCEGDWCDNERIYGKGSRFEVDEYPEIEETETFSR